MELKVNNRTIKFFTDLEVTRQFDSAVDSFGFQLYFNPDNDAHRELTEIGSFADCQIFEQGELFLTGTIVSQTFTSNQVTNLVTIQGYSKTGVLTDSNVPPSLYPLQTEGLSVLNIAKRLCDPFEINVINNTTDNSVTDIVTESNASETQRIAAYIAELTAQRNVVLTTNEAGDLVMTKANVNQPPVFTFRPETNRDVTAMNLGFNGQNANSEVTVMKEASDDPADEAGQSTVINPLVKNSFRPAVNIQTSGDEFDTDKAAKLALATQLRNLSLTIELQGWRLDGQIVKPNSIIEVLNPELHLYESTRFFIETVTYKKTPQGETATINCVLPEVYGGVRQIV